MIIQGQVGPGGFANNRFAELSAGKYCMTSALIIKIVIAAIFIIVIRVATDQPAPTRPAPVAFCAETVELSQFWLFGLTPIFGHCWRTEL